MEGPDVWPQKFLKWRKVDRPAAVAKRELANQGFRKKRHALDSLDVRVLERCLWIYREHRDEFFA